MAKETKIVRCGKHEIVAPVWAKWLAFDSAGTPWFHEKEPICLKGAADLTAQGRYKCADAIRLSPPTKGHILYTLED